MSDSAGDRPRGAGQKSAAVHPTALCEAQSIGEGSRVEAFASIAADCIVGHDCTIAEHAVLGLGVHLADDVRALTGARILVLAAHPDDESLGAGGTLAANAVRSEAIRVWIATDGTGQEGVSPEDAVTMF